MELMKKFSCLLLVVLAAAAGTSHSAPTDSSAEELELLGRLNRLLREKRLKEAREEQASSMVNSTDGGPLVARIIHLLEKKWNGQRASPGLTQAQKDKVVELHNKLRTQEGSSNMDEIFWNDRLGELAQNWADRCSWGHRPPSSYKPTDYGFKTIGENIWAWSTDAMKIPDKPVADWFAEKQYYDYNTGQCSKEPCGHYLTIVGATTRAIGCGLAKCSTLQNSGFPNGGVFMVCNYGPWSGDKPPYKKGAPCTECGSGKFLCTDGLCDSSCKGVGSSGKCECKADCNCGQQTGACECKCTPGYTGVSCSEPCKDKDAQCGANPGWPESWCNDPNAFGGMMYDTVRAKCPAMCKLCQKSDGTPCKGRSTLLDSDDAKDLEEIRFLINALEKKEKGK